VETSLLKTKLSIPPIRPQLVSRPRLTERLKEGLKCDLILISAPAGFGKTTLLSEWARQSQPNIQTAWVSLDEGDNDPIRFWAYFIAALQTLQPAVGDNALTLLHNTQPFPGQIPPIESVLTVLINDLANVQGEFVVALDDYHLIESQQIHDGITFLLDHLPSQIHLVIATRADPSLPIARFRGKGMMLEIGADDLRFTLDETVSFFQEMKALELSTDDVGALNTRTEGWVVGLKMAALAMQRQPDIPEFLASFTGSQRYVMDYLMEEVLQKQTAEIRDFLLKTSVLNRLTAPLCDAVTERKDSQDILLNLERGHLFIVPLDESRQWYRYEHLFADILHHQLESTYDVDTTVELHRRASQWYEDNNHPDEAIHHALASQDWEKAARLIRDAKKFERGEFVTLINWLQQLPEEVLHGDMTLCERYCAALITARQLDAADSIINYIEQAGERDDILLQGRIAGHRCGIAYFRGDFSYAWELGEKALSLLPPDYGEPRWAVIHFLGVIQWSRGLLKEAEALLTEAYQAVLSEAKDNQIASGPISLLGLVYIELGKLNRAAAYCRQASGMARVIPHVARALDFLAFLLYEWNDLEASAFHNRQAIESARLSRYMEAITWSYYELAHISMVQGDEGGALELLEKADQSVPDADPLWARTCQVNAHIRFALLQDNLAAAAKWGATVLKEPGYTPPLFYAHIPVRLLAHIPIRLLIAQGNKTEAAKELQVMYESAVQTGAQHSMIIYRLYQALAADNEESALEFLIDALTKAEPEGYIRTFVDEGRLLAPLLEKVISRGIKPEYAGKLLRIIEEEQHRKSVRREKGPVKIPYETLSEREMEVLRFLAAGFSNRQIAERLVISIGTVKTHVHNIMAKLEASGRIQVITRARELNLI
jgi:LuxR family maltose regulon positive regulatory protein